ncbi:LLM class flavin-dependent oxidoreductase [Natrarchaeobius oligotrophus]|uniref:LLM class flavin-dependent oxidoreductase n=1 Tax=Natrarchaeobius chitinivorans TaxID=1679083 RepID=A0A3N6NJW6_NATCH|nr:LLM class flavin-dependent oxidoreductase [Natrarchaeobius chitinivorans]RQG99442.1 LLM class flavin-dependent oxidoreductase [Natrarchaeobius chitinivorans]
MVDIGLYASLEQFSPAECLEQTVLAEEAGFESVWVNDHFHPWFDRVGDGSEANGGDCWTWMPVALERTDDITIGPGVTAVLNRHHPANLAHHMATIAELYPDRLVFGIGTGAPLNEDPLGFPWPEYGERARRTAEAIRIVRKLFEEDYVDFDGNFWQLNSAHLYNGPNEAPPIHVAANGPMSARMAGDLGDGLFTVPEADPESLAGDLFPGIERGVEKSAHNEDPDEIERSVNVLVSYGETENEAMRSIKPWRVLLLPMMFEHAVSDPRYLQKHGDLVGEEQLADSFTITTDPADLIDIVDEWNDAGFDRVVFHSASPDQERFIETVRDEVMPSF